MAKIKEIIDNNLEVKFKKFKKITGYSLWGKQSWNIGKQQELYRKWINIYYSSHY